MHNLKSLVESYGGKLTASDISITIQMPPTKKQEKQNQSGDFIIIPGTNEIAIEQGIFWVNQWFEYWDLSIKISKKQIKEFLKKKLSTDEKWAIQALLRIFEKQTLSEVKAVKTIDHNNVGFTGHDAELMTSFAVQYKTRNFLSVKQKAIIMKVIPKYWHQIYDSSDKLKLLHKIKASLPESVQLNLRLR